MTLHRVPLENGLRPGNDVTAKDCGLEDGGVPGKGLWP